VSKKDQTIAEHLKDMMNDPECYAEMTGYQENALLAVIELLEKVDIDRLRDLVQADAEGRCVVLDEKPLPLVTKDGSTDAYCPYCDEDVSGCWGIDDSVPDVCQCPNCGCFMNVCVSPITRQEAEAALKEESECGK
jgi:hypothetical protein